MVKNIGVTPTPLTILYCHGLGSNGSGNTANALRALGINVVSPSYRPEHANESMVYLSSILQETHIDVVIGSSLGGYYAMRLAQEFNLPTLAVNPCFDPAYVLEHFSTLPAINYADNAEIIITQDMVNQFIALNSTNLTNAVSMVISQQDELLPYDYQKKYCIKMGWAYQTTPWGHRIEDVPWLLAQAHPLLK